MEKFQTDNTDGPNILLVNWLLGMNMVASRLEGKAWPAGSEQTTKIYRSQKMEGEMID